MHLVKRHVRPQSVHTCTPGQADSGPDQESSEPVYLGRGRPPDLQHERRSYEHLHLSRRRVSTEEYIGSSGIYKERFYNAYGRRVGKHNRTNWDYHIFPRGGRSIAKFSSARTLYLFMGMPWVPAPLSRSISET
jgi:hypothetical protein